MKKKVILTIVALVCAVLCILISGASCSSCDRMGKSINSNMSGGLDRIVNVYSYSGKKIASHEGKLDLQDNEDKVLFDMNGKRYVYYNAVVEVIEK